MEIRPATTADLGMLADIDATIESSQYLHLELTGEGMSRGMKLEPRPLRSKRIESYPISDEQAFVIRQIVGGADEGIVLVAEHEDVLVALGAVQPCPERGAMRILDLRVDYDHRRQGLATAMIYQFINAARQQELRAVYAETRTNNFPANQMLQKLGFELSGLDVRRHSNHDMVKEAATIFWYAALEE